jgi:PAS domain S-box-containing protein
MDASRYIVESMTDYAMMFLDGQGIIRFWNPGAARIFGYSAEEAVGRHFSILFRDEDRRDGVPESELRKADAESCVSDTRWLVRKDSTAFWAEGSAHAVREQGSVIGFSKLVRDAGERLRLEQHLEKSNEEREKFAYTISHDLKEPVRTIRSYTELLQRRYRSSLDADADEFMQFILDAAGRMDRLLADILAYSQAGRHDKTRPEPTQAANVLQWALMNLDGMAKQSSATITWDPLPVVLADQNQLVSLFQHLLTNALKFRSSEPPRIHISAEPTGSSQWLFQVRDNGIGMDPDQTERMFGVFKRMVGREVPGTGIGLAICRKIVEAHGGRIWIDSAVGQGSTVKFTLSGYES